MKFRAHLKPVEFEAGDDVDAWDVLDAVLSSVQVECTLIEEIKDD